MLVTHDWPFTLSVKRQTLYRVVSKRQEGIQKTVQMQKYEWRKQQRCDTTEELKAKVPISACTN